MFFSRKKSIPEIKCADAAKMDDALWVDVREKDEWDAGHVPDAIHVPLSALMEGKEFDLPKDVPLIMYCHMGMRSKKAAGILQTKGYKNLHNLTGGYSNWQQNCAAA